MCECFNGKRGAGVSEIAASARVRLQLLAAANIFVELENSSGDNRENETTAVSRALAFRKSAFSARASAREHEHLFRDVEIAFTCARNAISVN